MSYRAEYLQVQDESQTGHARRTAAALAEELQLSESVRGAVSIVATEMARNIVKHGGGGEMAITMLQWPSPRLELLALDKGSGIADMEASMRDGYSTAGTPGTGMGAIARLSHAFEIYSNPNQGTAVLARFLAQPEARHSPHIDIGAVSHPAPGEQACGDHWFCAHNGRELIMAVADGLGHGPIAEEAALEAMRVVQENLDQEPADMIRDAHLALQKTRGAALAIAAVDFEREQIRYAGVGNIAGVIDMPDATRSMVSYNGTVGHAMGRSHQLTYPCPRGATILMHSDGITGHWDLKKYRGLASRSASLIAGVVYRDHRRGKDDATVLVARESKI